MARRTNQPRRHGTVLPMVAVSLVGLCGFVALAVDVGMIAVAKTEAQNAADAAALAGARSIDGSSSPNLAGATTNAQNAAIGNKVLSTALLAGDVAVQHGTYHYDPDGQKFLPILGTPTAPDTYNLTRATVTRQSDTSFARIVGFATSNVTATATAAHRPRDVTIVLDYSGSMNNESDLWNNEGYLGTANNSPNNTDPIVPKFGHYSDTTNAKVVCTSTDPRVGKCNITQGVLGVTSLISGFYQHNRGSTPGSAFSAAPSSYQTTPGGDNYLKTSNNSGSTYAATVNDVLGGTTYNASFELDGYSKYTVTGSLGGDYTNAPFRGYTQGPGYWGKTFFIWPPDPRVPVLASEASTIIPRFLKDFGYTTNQLSNNALVKGIYQNGAWPWPADGVALGVYLLTVPKPNNNLLPLLLGDPAYNQILRLHDRRNRPKADWRQRFFLKPGGSHPNFGGPIVDNNDLWDASGNWLNPQGNYVINYREILKWIKNGNTDMDGPNPFPTQLRAGRILYYDQIPDDVPAAAYDHTDLNSDITNANQRFWKEYIDFVLGVWRDPFGTIQNPGNPACSYGPDFAWGTVKVSARPTDGTNRYMDYSDNPERPRHRFWFGPMTMVQFLLDTKLLPGTATDISMYSAKLGISGALQDIKNNHPNDLVSMILYNRPQYANDPAGIGSFSQVQFALSRDYSGMIDALWFPPGSGQNDVRPWDSNGVQTPRAYGDYTSNTATSYGFMLAYNQFASSSTLRGQTVGGQSIGGLGRKGAQRLVVLETDGMANWNSTPTNGFNNGGPNNSYYRILPGDPVNGGGYNQTDLLKIVQAICNKENGSPGTSPGFASNPGYPGFALTRKPVLIHTIAFGAIMESTASGAEQTNVVNLLDQISKIGGTRFPSSASDATDGYKWCVGSLEERKTKLRQAFSKIMDDGISVSLVQ